MKYNTYSISAGLVIFASLAPGILFAENNVGFGVGSGGQAGAVNISIDYSKFTTDKHLNYIFGCGFSAIFNNDNVPGEILDYSIPHYDYHVIHKQPNPEYAFYTKLGIFKSVLAVIVPVELFVKLPLTLRAVAEANDPLLV